MRQLVEENLGQRKVLWILKSIAMKKTGRPIIMSSCINMIMKPENHWKGPFSAFMNGLMTRTRSRMRMAMG